MVESFLKTKRDGWTRMIIYLNDDDPRLMEYTNPEHPDIKMIVGPRRYIAEVFNWFSFARRADYYSNLNDDHLFVTEKWDEKLIALAEEKTNGWGIACADDKLTNWAQYLHPSGCVISGKATRALGWIAAPGVRHIGIDVVQGKLFGALGLLHFTKDVVIEHRHWVNGMRPMDDNYKWVYGKEEQDHGEKAVQDYMYEQFEKDKQRLKKAIAEEP